MAVAQEISGFGMACSIDFWNKIERQGAPVYLGGKPVRIGEYLGVGRAAGSKQNYLLVVRLEAVPIPPLPFEYPTLPPPLKPCSPGRQMSSGFAVTVLSLPMTPRVAL